MLRVSKSKIYAAAALFGAVQLGLSPAQAGPFEGFGRHVAGAVAGAVTQEVVKEVGGTSDEVRVLAAVAGVGVAVGVSGDSGLGSVAGHALAQAVYAGATSDWFDRQTNRRGRYRVLSSDRRDDPVDLRYDRNRVSEVPPLDLWGGDYVAPKSVNVRGGPSTKYAKVGKLEAGEIVNVVGKVKGRNWLLISRDGVGQGYVFQRLLRPAPVDREPRPDPLDELTGPEPDIAEHRLSDTRLCRTVENSVTNPDGETTVEVFTACESPEGWTVVEAEDGQTPG